MQADVETEYSKLQKMVANNDSRTLIEIQTQKVTKKEAALTERQQSAQSEVEAYSRELNIPILTRIESAIKTVSDRHAYDYVLDKSMLIVSNGPDITKEVIEEVLKLEGQPRP